MSNILTFKHLIASWNYNRWVLLDCPGNEPDREQREIWLRENAASLPTPKRQLQETVVFKWSGDTMRGEIRKITCYIDDGVPKLPFHYEIYSSGHGRSTYENKIQG